MSDSSSGPEKKEQRRETTARLVAALERLEPDRRTVVELRNFEGLPFEEVAQRMGRSNAAVRKLWTRALDDLREAMGEKQ
jgi:RNA polymerase sigma-70 factor (ECF subfamily)